MEPRIRAEAGAEDVVIARAIATGHASDGRVRRATVDVRVHPDQALGFTAMERATGWHAAIVCHRMASGRVTPGATPVELAIPAGEMMEELRLRGFDVDERVEP
jgi:lysine 6-dehydrogenase